jgi:hypothetical protein
MYPSRVCDQQAHEWETLVGADAGTDLQKLNVDELLWSENQCPWISVALERCLEYLNRIVPCNKIQVLTMSLTERL